MLFYFSNTITSLLSGDLNYFPFYIPRLNYWGYTILSCLFGLLLKLTSTMIFYCRREPYFFLSKLEHGIALNKINHYIHQANTLFQKNVS